MPRTLSPDRTGRCVWCLTAAMVAGILIVAVAALLLAYPVVLQILFWWSLAGCVALILFLALLGHEPREEGE